MAIHIDTTRYEATHSRTPRQDHHYATSPWAFQIDRGPEPVFITASYRDAVKQALALATYSITVLP